jgi:hypothetical protein
MFTAVVGTAGDHPPPAAVRLLGGRTRPAGQFVGTVRRFDHRQPDVSDLTLDLPLRAI